MLPVSVILENCLFSAINLVIRFYNAFFWYRTEVPKVISTATKTPVGEGQKKR